MPDVSFPVEVVLGVPVVAAPEEIDITNATGLRAALVEAAAQGNGTYVVDMTHTLFCDSAGLHALVSAHRRALAEGGAVLLAGPGAAVLRILTITGIDRVIPSATSLEEALAQTTCAAVAPPQPSECALGGDRRAAMHGSGAGGGFQSSGPARSGPALVRPPARWPCRRPQASRRLCGPMSNVTSRGRPPRPRRPR